MSVVIDSRNGTQVLPDVGDQHATLTAWTAQLTANADQRTKSNLYMTLARRLTIYPDCCCENDFRCPNHDTDAEAARYAPRRTA